MSSNTTSQPFTEKEFCEEVCRLREQMGDKRFWARPKEQREAYVSGLSFMYLNIDNEDGSKPTQEQLDKWAMIFDGTMVEYRRRELYVEAGI